MTHLVFSLLLTSFSVVSKSQTWRLRLFRYRWERWEAWLLSRKNTSFQHRSVFSHAELLHHALSLRCRNERLIFRLVHWLPAAGVKTCGPSGVVRPVKWGNCHGCQAACHGSHWQTDSNRSTKFYLTTPLSRMVCHPWASTCYDHPMYQIWSLTLSPSTRNWKAIQSVENMENGVAWNS